MAELTPAYRTLDSIIEENYSDVYELCSRDPDGILPIDWLDCGNRVTSSPAGVLSTIEAHRRIAGFFKSTEDEWRASYRAFFLGIEVGCMAGEYQFSLSFPDLEVSEWTPRDIQYAVHEHLAVSPATHALIEDCMHEITLGKHGRHASIGRTVAGLTFMLVEEGMYETYCSAQQIAELEAQFSEQ
jgi:hypothetical protein